jgi:hypothetical protein
MKRLIAITKQTMGFGINTQAELDLISQKYADLTKEKLHPKSKYTNEQNKEVYEGLFGGIYYEMENDKIHLYVVENFYFIDVDKSLKTQKNVAVFVASRLHGDGQLDAPKYADKIEGATVFQTKADNVKIEGMGLVRLKALTLEQAKVELANIFKDFTEDKLD